MRSSLVSVLLGLSFVAACNVGDAGTGGGGGGGGGGDPQPDAGGSQDPVPRVALSVDKPAVSTELLTKNMITVTLTGSGGFAGDVTLAATVVDASSQPVPGWSTVSR